MTEASLVSLAYFVEPKFNNHVVVGARSSAETNNLRRYPSQEALPVGQGARQLAAHIMSSRGCFDCLAEVLNSSASRHEQVDGYGRVQIRRREGGQVALYLVEVVDTQHGSRRFCICKLCLLSISQGHLDHVDAASADDKQRFHRVDGSTMRFGDSRSLGASGCIERPCHRSGRCYRGDSFPVEQISELRPPVPPRLKPIWNQNRLPNAFRTVAIGVTV